METIIGRKKREERREQERRRAALYCRVNAFDQNLGDHNSLADQETRLRPTAEAEGYEVCQVFKAVASSASLDRDELRLPGKLEEIDAIVVTKLDRLSRSMHDWCRLNELSDVYWPQETGPRP